MAIQAAGTVLDGCVLSLLSENDAYGYNITQQLKGVLGVSESTLYPVMRRLQTDGLLTTYDIPHNGRNRRYYKITDNGAEKLKAHCAEWAAFKKTIDNYLTTDKPEGE